MTSPLPNLSHLKAIFFDLDDVLVFSERAHNQAWQIAFSNLGIDVSHIDFQSIVGISDTKQAHLLNESLDLKLDPESLYEAKKEAFLTLTQSGFESAQGRDEILKKVSKNYVIGVVSSSRNPVIQKVLDLEKITSFFNFIIGFEDCARHKPDPLPYQQALQKVGIEPHEALVIEDSVSGVTAALNASIPVIGLFRDQQPHQIIQQVPYFNHFNDISEALFA